MSKKFFLLVLMLLILGACASRIRDQMKLYREAYALGDYEKADKLLENSELKKDEKSRLLWLLEKGTTQLARENHQEAIASFQESLDLIDKLFTTKLSSKAASLFINDASDEFYGASYERSYAHYFLAKSYYGRYLKSNNKLDLQGARGTILAWDSYFQQLQRSATNKTLYHTDLMLKVFGAQIHEISGIKNDRQIALQLYKDALQILQIDGGIFTLFNKKSADYVKIYQQAIGQGKGPPQELFEPTAAFHDLKDLLHFKILSLTQDMRGNEMAALVKSLAPTASVLNKLKAGKSNVVLVLEEGLIPAKIGKQFNFGIKGAVNSVESPAAKAFIATVGVAALSMFAMNKLNMMPTQAASPGNFLFAYDVTRLAVTEAAISFELPMIDNVPLVQRLELFILDDKGVIIEKTPLPVISENGDIARVVLEEDVVARYVKTGSRVAAKHILAIVAAMQVYRQLSRGNQGDFLAMSAAMATYVTASKGIAALEQADTRHWTTLPQALRMADLSLAPGQYQIALSAYSGQLIPQAPAKILGTFQVPQSGRTLHTFKFVMAP